MTATIIHPQQASTEIQAFIRKFCKLPEDRIISGATIILKGGIVEIIPSI